MNFEVGKKMSDIVFRPYFLFLWDFTYVDAELCLLVIFEEHL